MIFPYALSHLISELFDKTMRFHLMDKFWKTRDDGETEDVPAQLYGDAVSDAAPFSGQRKVILSINTEGRKRFLRQVTLELKYTIIACSNSSTLYDIICFFWDIPSAIIYVRIIYNLTSYLFVGIWRLLGHPWIHSSGVRWLVRKTANLRPQEFSKKLFLIMGES